MSRISREGLFSGAGGKDAHDLFDPAMARAADHTCSFQPCQAPFVRAGAARAHHRLETRYGLAAIRDQNRLAVSHEIQQRTELVLRLGDRHCLHQAMIAHSTNAQSSLLHFLSEGPRVLLMTMRKTILLVVLLLVAQLPVHADAPPLAELERLLVPIATEPLHGAFGSLWESDLWLVTTSDNLFIGPLVDRNCVQPGCGPPPPPLPVPFEAVRPSTYRTRNGEPPGILLYVSRDSADDAVFNLRVGDTNRRLVSSGVSIPIIRERDLKSGSAQLLNIVVHEHMRLRLRVYDPFKSGAARFRVRVFESEVEDVLQDEFNVELIDPASQVFPAWPYPLQPDSTELDVDVSGYADGTILRIEIVPLTANVRFWTFATVTNNLTNEVTIVTP
jgi:hypothetical protein